MFAGTGEGYFNIDRIAGAGIFKTTDGGGSWAQLASTANTNFSYVNDLVYKPASSSVIYAATGTGLWRSLNSGTSWTQVVNAASARGCMKVVYRSDADTAVASCGTLSPNDPANGIWTSTNASAASPTWTHVLGNPGSGATETFVYMGRISLAIAPSSQSTMYALISCSSPNCGEYDKGMLGVIQSTDGGVSWALVYINSFDLSNPLHGDLLLTNPLLARQLQCNLNNNDQLPVDQFLNQGWYDNVIAVDPLDPTKVWVGGTDLFRSDDSGASWGVASYWWKSPSDPHYAHADHHGIYFDPAYNGTTNQTMYVTNDGGIFKTTNARAAVGLNTNNDTSNSVCGTAGLPAVTWSNLNNGYGVTQFYHGSVYPSGTQYFAGAQDNGTSRGSDGSPNAWSEILGGDGGYTAINRNTSGATTVLYAENTFISLQKSNNNGAYFFCATNGIIDCNTQASNDDRGQFVNPFAIDPNNFENLWISGRYLWRTSDAAFTWTRASGDMLDNGSVCGKPESFSAEKVAFGDSNLVVAGTDCGNIYQSFVALSGTSTDGWGGTKPRGGYVSNIAFDPSNSSKVYAVYSTLGGVHVWKSIDFGQTFVGSDGTGTVLPNVPVTAIAVSPTNGNRIYVGTDIGVFVTTDGGANWLRENTGFPNVPTDRLVFNASGPTGEEIYAFTHGRGVFRAQISSSLLVSTTVLGSTPNASTYGQNVTLTATVSGGGGTPTGTVNFLDGGTTIASGVALVAGVATLNTTTLTAGGHSLKAIYSGSATYETSTGTNAQTVNKASTTVNLIGDNPDPTFVGQNITVTGTVTVVAPGGGTPTGTLEMNGIDSPGCSIPLPANNCKMFFTKSGSKTINGAYAGDANYNASISVVGRPHEVDPTGTTTTITSDNPDPSTVGQSVSVVVAVVGAYTTLPGTGTVTVTGSNTTGCTFNRPSTSCNVTFTATGAQTLSAAFGGNADYNASSTSVTTAHSVVTATTTTISADSPDPSVVGQPVQVTATVAPAGATGTITVTGTGTTGCLITLPATSCNATFTAAGSQSLSAAYGGDATFASSSTAAPTAHTVNKAATTLTIIDAPDPANANALVTVTATLVVTAPGAGIPTGTITVTGSHFPGCIITLPALSSSCTGTFTAGGVQTLNASYSGDANFATANATQVLHNDEIFKDGFEGYQAYDPAQCSAVAGTLDIYWHEVDGAQPACIGIEHTDGSLLDAADGSFSMNGVSVTNACLFPASYSFTLSADKHTLVGLDTFDVVPMVLTLNSDGSCFVGHWISGPTDFTATIWNFAKP